MEHKVFCNSCKHKKRIDWGTYTWHECKSNPREEYTFDTKYIVGSDCAIKNKNNDCKEFEKKMSLWDFIVTRFPVF